ncbi:unnamed protein product [Penicillium manginii]
MFSAAVENIRQLHANAGFAFFYFNFNDRSQQNASGMLRSLILQLLPKVHDDDCVKTLYRKWHSLGIEASETPLDKLIDCLGCLARQFADIYILIDALDECPQNEERESVLDSIATMRQWSLPALHVLVSSHDITDIRQSFNPQPGQAVNMRNPGVERDISNYVFHELTTRINLSHWKNDYLQIQALLNERAQGVFLYVASQLQLPLKKASLKRERDAVFQNLPLDMHETYERLLRRIDQEKTDNVRRVMSLLCYSNRPLTTGEVCHALAVDLQKTPCLDLEGLLGAEDQLRRICYNLIEITQTEITGNPYTSVVTISHSLLRQYLESERIRQQDVAAFAIDRQSANKEMAEICLVYLKYALSEKGRGLEKVTQFPFALFAAMEWSNYYLACSDKESGLQDLALQLFRDEDGGYFTAWIELYNADDGASPLYYASILGLDDIVDKMASTGSNVNAEGGTYGNSLQAASLKGHTAVVQLLIEYGADVNKKNGTYGTALQAASLKGHTEVVDALLGCDADPNIQAGRFGTALQAASSVGNKKIVQILLDHEANANACSAPHESALEMATQNGHEEIRNLLLIKGARSSPRNLGNELGAAAIRGDLEKMQEILNAENEHQDDLFKTAKDAALLGASHFCQEGAVRLLLERGADVNAQTKTFGNALYGASLTQREYSQQLFHEQIFRFLRVTVHDAVSQSLTAGGALESWFMDIILREESPRKQLLEQVSTSIFKNPAIRNCYKFMFASPEDSEKVVGILLTHGANVNAQGGKYGNALQAASHIGNEKVVKLLLEAGADVDSQGGFHGSAINAASAGGHSGVMQILRDRQDGIAGRNADQPDGLSSQTNSRP